jgi:hypothetical protein
MVAGFVLSRSGNPSINPDRSMASISFEDFRATLAEAAPPAGVGPALVAMWHDAKGGWEAAHRLAQSEENADGAWVHAYLHRVEGDLANAGYWYRRAGKPASEQPLPDEWTTIVQCLLAE